MEIGFLIKDYIRTGKMEHISGLDALKIVGMQSVYDVAYVKSNKASLSHLATLIQRKRFLHIYCAFTEAVFYIVNCYFDA